MCEEYPYEEYPYEENAKKLHDLLESITEGSIYLTPDDVRCLLAAIEVAYSY